MRAELAQVDEPAATADSGTAFVGLSESRNHDSKRTTLQGILWNVRSPDVVRAHVTAVHVHERANGRLLLTIPLDTMDNPGITNSYVTSPAGTRHIPWADIYEIVGDERAFLDVHVGGPEPRVLQGDLARQTTGRDWRAFQHSYCS